MQKQIISDFVFLPVPAEQLAEAEIDVFLPMQYYVSEGKLVVENVKDVGIASVCINGKDKGIVWTKPFRVDITDSLKEGENDVVVEVTNSWFNRVAGDEMAVSPTKYTQTNIILGNDFRGNAVSEITLEPSGLLGPVTIQVAVEQK